MSCTDQNGGVSHTRKLKTGRNKKNLTIAKQVVVNPVTYAPRNATTTAAINRAFIKAQMAAQVAQDEQDVPRGMNGRRVRTLTVPDRFDPSKYDKPKPVRAAQTEGQAVASFSRAQAKTGKKGKPKATDAEKEAKFYYDIRTKLLDDSNLIPVNVLQHYYIKTSANYMARLSRESAENSKHISELFRSSHGSPREKGTFDKLMQQRKDIDDKFEIIKTAYKKAHDRLEKLTKPADDLADVLENFKF